jgi:PhnB protein
MADATLELIPYVFFYGRCEEALNFYKSVLGGDFTMQRNSESHMAGDIPADWQDKIMHARFESKGMKLMAADGRAAASIDPDSGNITLALETSDPAEGDRIFAALSAGGNVKMPLSPTPWGGRFGMVDDRFNIEWMLSTP